MNRSLRLQILAMASSALTVVVGCSSSSSTPHSEMSGSGSEHGASGDANCGGNGTCGTAHPDHEEATSETPRSEGQPASASDAGVDHSRHAH